MSSEHTISVAAASRDGSRRANDPVSIPVGELMASNGLVTGQSGADPAASVRRVVESLVDAGETLFVVDPAGDFDALADHASVLHVGGDRNCDVQVRPAAVDRVASLALDGATSVVLDLTAFDAGPADDLLGGLTDALVDARRQRQAEFLLVVGECHRWLAANGPATRTGENLVQLGGRRHDGVGVVGVTDQPADVREDVLTGVDWVLAHRLTWREDVRALGQLLDRQYTDALEDLDDDEAFLNAGWERGVQRLRFGDEPARPEPAGRGPTDRSAASGSPDRTAESAASTDDLLADVPEARSPDHEGATAADDGVAELREDLAAIDDRLASLEAKLDAREDAEELADRIAAALTDGLRDADVDLEPTTDDRDGDPERDSRSRSRTEATATDDEASEAGSDDAADDTVDDEADADGPGGFGDVFGMFDDNDTVETADSGGQSAPDAGGASGPASTADAGSATVKDTDSAGSDSTGSGSTGSGSTGSGSTDAGSFGAAPGSTASDDPSSGSTDGNDGGMSFKPIDFGFDEPGQDLDSTVPDDFGPPSRRASSGRSIPRYLRKIVRSLEEMDATTRKMLAFYVDQGTEAPMDAHFSAGGGGDRTRAYAHNRQLRTNGLIEHVGKGQYAPRLREYVVDKAGHSVPEHELDRAVSVIEQTVDAA